VIRENEMTGREVSAECFGSDIGGTEEIHGSVSQHASSVSLSRLHNLTAVFIEN
jgi:hypothetical protein